MKFKISKADYEKLSDEQKALYTAKGDDYQMTIEGLPDFDGMQTKLNTLLDETKVAKQAKAEAEAKAKADLEEAARKAGNTEALDKSWGEKLAAEQAAHAATKQKYHGQVSKLMVSNVAQAMGTKLFGEKAAPLLHNIESRLSLEEAEDGSFKTRVLGADGKPSAHSIDDLAKEFSASEAFKPFLVTTKATGPTGGLQKAQVTRQEGRSSGDIQQERRNRAHEIASQESASDYGN